MKAALSNATHINCFVNESAFGVDGSKIQDRIEFLLEKNGPEWVVDRGKAIYNAAQNLRAGDKQSAIKIYQSNSIAYTKRGYPKDAFMLPVKVYVESTKRSQVKKAAGVLRFYTAHTLRNPSKRQIDKSIRTISSPPSGGPEREHWLEGIRHHCRNTMKKLGISNFAEGKNLRMSARHLNGFTATHSIDSNIPKDMLNIPYMNIVNSMSSSPFLPEGLQRLTPSMEMRDAAEQRNEELGLPTDLCGRIHIIQEGGCKPRVVAIPNSWIQLAFTPVHDVTSELAKGPLNRWSCMHDQGKGILQVQKLLQEGKNVSSIDLSAATDRFPIELQTDLLKEIGMEPWGQAMNEIAKGKWEFPQGNTTLSYNTGQPMGMYGSFPVFHCTHIILAKHCEEVVEAMSKDREIEPIQRFDDGTTFKIIGDDVVFSDHKVATIYADRVQKLGVEISEHKTFIDKPFAEFAGYTAIRDDKTSQVMVFKPYKQPKENYITNPVQFMEAFNRPPKQTKRWEQIFQSYSKSRSDRKLDLTPVFPEPDKTGTGQTRELVLESVESAAQTLYTYHSSRYTFESGKSFLELVVQDTIVDENPVRYGRGFPQQTRNEALRETVSRSFEPVRRAQQDPLIKRNLDVMESAKSFLKQQKPGSRTLCISRGADAPLNPLEDQMAVQAIADIRYSRGGQDDRLDEYFRDLLRDSKSRNVGSFNAISHMASIQGVQLRLPAIPSTRHSEEFLASAEFKDNSSLVLSLDNNNLPTVVTRKGDSPTEEVVAQGVDLQIDGSKDGTMSLDMPDKGQSKHRLRPDPDDYWDLDR